MTELTVALTLGKMPAETEKVGIAVIFKTGKGRLEKGRFVTFAGTRLPDSGYPELGPLWLATGMYKSETVVVKVVVPLVIVVVPSNS